MGKPADENRGEGGKACQEAPASSMKEGAEKKYRLIPKTSIMKKKTGGAEEE